MSTPAEQVKEYFETNHTEYADLFYRAYLDAPRAEQQRIENQANGARRGRKPLHAKRMVQRGALLSAEHIQIAKDLGDGNFSAGVRRALELATLVE